MAKQVLDIKAGKGMTTSQSNEHLRNANYGERLKRWSGNYDLTREHLNFEIRKGGVVCEVDKKTSIPMRIKKLLEERNIWDPNRGRDPPFFRTVANIILGGSRAQMHRLAFGEQQVNLEKGADNSMVVRKPEIENWAKDMYQFVCKRFGEKNIAAFVVHLDETNPHIHCTMLPITEDNKFSWKAYFGELKTDGYRIYCNLHSDIAKINQKYGLERGDRISETGAKHRSQEEYHKNLREQLQKENQQLNLTIEGNQKIISRQKAELSSLEKDIKHASARFKALQTMITNLESKKQGLMEEVVRLKQDRDSGKISAEEAQAKLDAIQKQLDEVDVKIADKTQKLAIAEKQLEKLQSKTLSAQQRYAEVQQRLQKDIPSLNKATLQEMQSMGFLMMATDTKHRIAKYNELLSTLPFEQRQGARQAANVFMDGSIAETIVDRAAHVASIATALYLGYLDAATKISQGGGGGGGPGAGWGKRDDEDDLAFRQRCFFMAVHMMRQGQKLQRKR